MVYSDTTNKNGLLQDCEHWTGLNDAGITGNTTRKAQFTSWLNRHYHRVVTIIMESVGWEAYDDPNHGDQGFIKTYNLTADTQYVTLPTSDKILKIRRVEAQMDGTNWVKLEPIKEGQIGREIASQDDVSEAFDKTKPFYELIGNNLYIYPYPEISVTNGLKVWVVREVDEFTTSDTTQEPGFAEPFHRMLSMGASLDWLEAKDPGSGTIATLRANMADDEARLRRFYEKYVDDGRVSLSSVRGVNDYA